MKYVRKYYIWYQLKYGVFTIVMNLSSYNDYPGFNYYGAVLIKKKWVKSNKWAYVTNFLKIIKPEIKRTEIKRIKII